MVLRTAATGRFYGCENYPKCRFTLSVETGVKCPEPGCDGDLIERKTRQGRRFYSCSRYPTCKFAVWDKPIPMPCPKCGAPFVVIKVREGEQMLRCRTKGCSFEQRPEIA